MSRQNATPPSATITPDERVKIDEFIRTKGVTLCEPAAAEGAFPDLESYEDEPLTPP